MTHTCTAVLRHLGHPTEKISGYTPAYGIKSPLTFCCVCWARTAGWKYIGGGVAHFTRRGLKPGVTLVVRQLVGTLECRRGLDVLQPFQEGLQRNQRYRLRIQYISRRNLLTSNTSSTCLYCCVRRRKPQDWIEKCHGSFQDFQTELMSHFS